MAGKSIDVLETDVLIIGGGWAGLFAALGAADAGGARITIVEKAPSIERSGGLGPGIADIGLPVYPDGSTDQQLIDYYVYDKLEASDFMADPRVVLALAELGQPMLVYQEKIGLEFVRDDKGLLKLHSGKGQWPHRPYEIFYKEPNTVKRRVARAVKKRDIQVVETCMVTRLLTEGDAVVGAVGVETRTGKPRAFKAKAIILTTGPGYRMYRHPTGIYWNSWNCPFSTYDGHMAAYMAGAELAGLEFTEPTIFPKDIGTPGTNPWLGSGGFIVNAKGERIMLKYDPRAESAPRARITWAITKELEAGNGPIYLDLRHVPREKIKTLYEVLHSERPSLDLYFAARGLDYSETLIEIEISERNGHQGGCSGVIVDADLKSNLTGLYAAGDAVASAGVDTGGTPCANGVCLGYRAGQKAAEFAKTASYGALDGAAIELEMARVRAPLERVDGLDWRMLNDKIMDIMGTYVGYPRTEAGMKRAVEKLEKLIPHAATLKASSIREMYRCLEVQNILEMSILTAKAAIERRESRLGIEHYRLDYPFRDDTNWIKYVVVRKGPDGQATISLRPIERLYWGYQRLER